ASWLASVPGQAAEVRLPPVAEAARQRGRQAASAIHLSTRADYVSMRLVLLALVALQPPFAHSVSRVTGAQLPYSWRTGCPVAPGPKHWSAHAYGLAIDVDPVENPYVEGGRVHPRAGRAYLDRSRVRPGMAVPGGLLVRAFAAVGWQWGGRWTASPDYQHF